MFTNLVTNFFMVYWIIGVALLLNGNVLAQDAAKSTTKLFACFGESIELNCQDGETIEVQDAYYELLKKDDKRCTLVSNTTFLCQEKQLRDQVQYQCGGKGKCLLKQDVQDFTNECLPAMYLTVEFQCIHAISPIVVPRRPPGSSQVNNSLEPTTTTTTTSVTSSSEASNGRISFHMRLILFFMELRSAGRFVRANPRKSILCVILSLAFGISLLIVYMLIFACYNKLSKADSSSDVAKDEADGVKQILLSQPVSTLTANSSQPTTYETVLVTRENGVALQETTISSDSSLTLTRKNSKNKHKHHAEVITTIKRTHSIDEGTQTDIDEEPIARQPRTLSMQEAQELGDLVNVMNYYNSRIDDDDAFYPSVSGSFTAPNNNNNNTSTPNNSRNRIDDPRLKYRQQDKYHYANRGPSFADRGRSSPMTPVTADRKPLLSRNNSVPIPPSPYHLRNLNNNQDFHKKRNLSRNPSELSYNTSASESSLGNYSPEAIFNGDNLRHPSISRTPKPGVRGDGYEFIGNSSTRSSNR